MLGARALRRLVDHGKKGSCYDKAQCLAVRINSEQPEYFRSLIDWQSAVTCYTVPILGRKIRLSQVRALNLNRVVATD